MTSARLRVLDGLEEYSVCRSWHRGERWSTRKVLGHRCGRCGHLYAEMAGAGYNEPHVCGVPRSPNVRTALTVAIRVHIARPAARPLLIKGRPSTPHLPRFPSTLFTRRKSTFGLKFLRKQQQCKRSCPRVLVGNRNQPSSMP